MLKSKVRNIIESSLLIIILFFMLSILSYYNFLLFHSIVECFSIVVACSIFIFAWNSQKFLKNDFLVFLGIGFLFVACIDFIQLFSYEGINIFLHTGKNKALQLLMASQILLGITFLVSPYLINKNIRINLIFLLYTVIFILLIFSVFIWKNFPKCIDTYSGLTYFCKSLEYISFIIFTIAIVHLHKHIKYFHDETFKLLISSIIFMIISETIILRYLLKGGIYNNLGHFLKIISYYLIYQSIIVTGYEKPYNLLFRNLKISEEQAKKEKNFAESVISTVNVIIILLDTNEKIIRVNRHFEDITEYKANELISKKFYDTLIPKDYVNKIKNIINLPEEKKNNINNSSPLFTKSGKELFIEWFCKSISNDNSKYSGTLIIGLDITNKVIQENLIRESEEKYHKLFSLESDAILLINKKNDRIMEANQAAVKLYGYTREEILNLKFSDILASEKEEISSHISCTPGNTVFFEYHVKKDGTKFPAEISESTFQLSKKNALCKIVRDVTNILQTETQLIKRNEELNNFAHMVSHDLKTPLSIISGYLEVIKDEPETFDDYFNNIQEQTFKMADFIDGLLHLSRAGKVIFEKTQIDLNLLINQLFEKIKPKEKNYQLIILKKLPEIYGDKEKIEHVFLNLFSNSIQHRDPNKDKLLIKLDYKEKQDHYIFIINDNGLGIKKEFIENIFNVGFTKGKKNGTGFGLAIVKKIIEVHKGSIWASSKGDEMGASFFIKFPKK